MSPDRQQTGAQSVYRAMAILNAFGDGKAAMSVSEIASRVQLTIPTTHRLANALADEGFLTRDDGSRTFGIGPAVLRLGQVAISDISIISSVDPLIQLLRDSRQETVGLHVRAGGQRACVREVESPHRVRVVSGVGHTYPLTAGAAGKAILAFTRPTELAELTSADKITDLDGFRETLICIREQGFAISDGETIPGARAVAAPVLDGSGHATAAINITGPAARLPFELLREIGVEVSDRLRTIHEARYTNAVAEKI